MSLKSKSLEEERYPKRKRKPKRLPLDSYFEYGLSDGKGNFWAGNDVSTRRPWAAQTGPTFNEYGRRWANEKRALELWAEYNLMREIQKADWPDLVLEKFEISVKSVPAPDLKAPNWSKLVPWHKNLRDHDIHDMAEDLIKSNVEFKYIMKYIGDGTELPSNLVKRLRAHEQLSWGQGARVVVAFDSDKDMVFARMTLGPLVKQIISEDAVVVYKAQQD